jgi:hypothetical protein
MIHCVLTQDNYFELRLFGKYPCYWIIECSITDITQGRENYLRLQGSDDDKAHLVVFSC